MTPIFRLLLSSHFKLSYVFLAFISKLAAATLDISNELELVAVSRIQSYATYLSSSPNQYSVRIVTTTTIFNDDVVKVECSSTSPSKSDWIGTYIYDADITSSVPLKYGYCSADPNYLISGVGTIGFQLTNIRNYLTFYLFIGDLSKPIAVAKSNETIRFMYPNEPLRPRVVLTGDTDSLKLLWSSGNSTAPTLHWGTQSGVYLYNVGASTSIINKESLCGAPANSTGWFDLGFIHTALFRNLLPIYNNLSENSPTLIPKIYYMYGDAATNDFSAEKALVLPPLAGQVRPVNRPTTLALVADLGRGSNDMSYTWHEYGRPAVNTSNSIHKHVLNDELDAFFHIGDISYSNGFLSTWDFFLDMMAPIASSVVYMTALGNHESDWPGAATYFQGKDSGGECGILSTTLLPLPAPAQLNSPWWSYNIGLIHIVGLSSEHDIRIGSAQYKWLENDLSSVDRSLTPWLVLGSHRAMYINTGGTPSAINSDKDFMELMVSQLEPLIWKHRVNVGFYGHTHVYQRHSAIYNYTVVMASKPVLDESGSIINTYANPQATVHSVIGTGGAHFYMNDRKPPPNWNELTFYRFGYVILRAANATYLQWDWIDSNSDMVIDRCAIHQDLATNWSLSFFNDSGNGNNNMERNYTAEIANIWIGILFTMSILIYILHRFMLHSQVYGPKETQANGRAHGGAKYEKAVETEADSIAADNEADIDENIIIEFIPRLAGSETRKLLPTNFHENSDFKPGSLSRADCLKNNSNLEFEMTSLHADDANRRLLSEEL